MPREFLSGQLQKKARLPAALGWLNDAPQSACAAALVRATASPPVWQQLA